MQKQCSATHYQYILNCCFNMLRSLLSFKYPPPPKKNKFVKKLIQFMIDKDSEKKANVFTTKTKIILSFFSIFMFKEEILNKIS